MGRSIIDGFHKKLSEVKYTGGGHNEKRQAYHNLKQVVQGLRIKYGLKSKICKEVDIKNKNKLKDKIGGNWCSGRKEKTVSQIRLGIAYNISTWMLKLVKSFCAHE